MIYLKLFLAFLEIGAVSFGGGYAMIAMIRDKALQHGWLTESEISSGGYTKRPYTPGCSLSS